MSCLARRTVLKGAAAACGAGLLSACADSTGGTDAPPAAGDPAPGDGGRATLGQLTDIEVGGAVTVSAPDGSQVLLSRTSETEVVGFRAACPHEGCNVEPDDGQFSCPCHGSQFELNGDLKRGPAREGLSEFAVRVMDGQILPA